MTVLTQLAGLPLSISDEAEDLHYSDEEVDCSACGTIKLRDISPSLLNKSLMYPEQVYKHHKEMKLRTHSNLSGNYTYDVIYLPDGLLGIEYIKTHIFFAPESKPIASIVQVLSGNLTVLMQKNRQKQSIYDLESHVDEAILVEASEGEKVAIPSGFYYTFVNTSSEPTAFARVVSEEHLANYEALRRESGLAYYLISKNARQEVVVNPRYRTVPDLKSLTVTEVNTRTSYSPNCENPLYEEAMSSKDILQELFNI